MYVFINILHQHAFNMSEGEWQVVTDNIDPRVPSYYMNRLLELTSTCTTGKLHKHSWIVLSAYTMVRVVTRIFYEEIHFGEALLITLTMIWFWWSMTPHHFQSFVAGKVVKNQTFWEKCFTLRSPKFRLPSTGGIIFCEPCPRKDTYFNLIYFQTRLN